MDEHVSNAMLEQALLAGLPESESGAIGQHLASCKMCQCSLESLGFWTEVASDGLGAQGHLRRQPTTRCSPRAECAQKAALKEDVEQLLDFVAELIRKERECLRDENHAALIPIVEELELALDEQARAIAAFTQHKNEHGC